MLEVVVHVANPNAPERFKIVRLPVSSRVTLSFLGRKLLAELGIKPLSRLPFTFTDGRQEERDTGFALITLEGKTCGVPVAFAEEGENSVLGMTALEILRFVVDPVELKLVPRKHLALEILFRSHTKNGSPIQTI